MSISRCFPFFFIVKGGCFDFEVGRVYRVCKVGLAFGYMEDEYLKQQLEGLRESYM
jgi:hypothetical protein